MKIKLVAIALFITISTFAQTTKDSIVISGHLKNNTRFAKVVVQKFGVGSFAIAAVPIKDGKFSITAPANLESGVYRFQYSQSSLTDYIDLIIDGKEKNITFELDVLQPKESRIPVFTASELNKKWYSYQKESNLQLQKIELLNGVLAQYPNPKDKIVTQIEKAAAKEIKDFNKNFKQFCQENQNNWAGAMVQNKPYYFTSPKEDYRLQNFERRAHYWDNVNTNDPKLINSPLYTDRILQYIQYYMNPEMQYGEEEMNEGFKNSVDTIMQKFGTNEETKKFAIKYLQLGFKEIGNESVLQYIDEKYASVLAQCNDANLDKAAFEKRMEGYAAMKIGNQAPDIELKMESEKWKVKSLYEIKTEQTIVVFWASWCLHCMEEMPKLNEWAKQHPNTTVLAISLDEDATAYKNAIRNYPNMVHSCDFKKWESKPIQEYYIVATPTFIMLDKDKKIVGKYVNINQIVE
ncbi:AhpC/TSA family protein [Chryseobacterium sp. PS-8]|uniref:AhpC/TSA family protein n=1 Tax=Chryseobacterium indicum TaxID=2766954 RepID=A0ABS9C517_9FLAO|nr:AhpC/TSA family protein [Chryseobacterium sp. PS-8]MCF2218774.1 AhpC/TSA family protein [Chryseobacterium sp. PS-8]